jgi:plastocyanin domain-containing protein
MASRIRAGIGGWACVLAFLACSKSENADVAKAAPVTMIGGSTKITVDAKGFTPSDVRVEKGQSASLVFVRTTDSTCAKQVVFPELKMQKDLPLDTPVAIEVPTDKARTLTFQCGMGMYQSSVVIQ